MTEHLLSSGGIMVADDRFFHGDVANNEPVNEKGEGTKAFMDWAATRRLATACSPTSNGIYLMVRK